MDPFFNPRNVRQGWGFSEALGLGKLNFSIKNMYFAVSHAIAFSCSGPRFSRDSGLGTNSCEGMQSGCATVAGMIAPKLPQYGSVQAMHLSEKWSSPNRTKNWKHFILKLLHAELSGLKNANAKRRIF